MKIPAIPSCSRERGITLIELIITIVVTGIVVIGLMSALMNIVGGSTKPEDMVKADYLAQQKMEELTENPFGSIAIVNQAYTSAGVTGFQWSWQVEYIDGITFAASGSPTNYKRITVKVKDPSNSELSFYTIVTKRYNDGPTG